MKAPKKTTTKETTSTSKETTVKSKETTAVKQLIFPTLKESIPMTDEEKALFDIIRASPVVAGENVTPLFDMYNRLFNQKKKRCMCASPIRNMIETITKYYY